MDEQSPSSSSMPQTQKERWMTYGVNVVVTSIVVIALACVVIAIAERQHRRFDTSANKEYSLKPQTINIIKDLQVPVKLVSLYSRSERTGTPVATDYPGAVEDLLEEYKQDGRNIDVETIDPVANPTKVDDLIREVMTKYGGEVQKYRDFVGGAARYFAPIRQFGIDELEKLKPIPIDRMANDDLNQALATVSDTLAELPPQLDKIVKDVDAQRTQKMPDYKGAADTIQTEAQRVADIAAQVSAAFGKFKDDPKTPAAVKQYMADSIPRWDAVKKEADSIAGEYKNLGELKLDDLRQKLRERDAILVMGPTDMRSLSFDQVWQPDTDKKSYENQADTTTIKPKFAGEQQITSAILSLTAAKKPKVVFLRPGGAPLTTPGFPPFQQGGPFSKIAERLQDYNFDVLEKDMSGQYAMQAQMQGQQVQPDPTDDEIKDAVWIVLSTPTNPQQPTPSIAPKLAEHLKNGGAALCLFMPNSDNLSDVLKDWGVTVRTDLLIVHEPVVTSAESSDFVEQARKNPIVFVLNHYGDHLITKPLVSLDSALVPLLPVVTEPTPGYESTAIIPIPNTPKSWGEHNVDAALNNEAISFKPEEGDMAPPLYAGAVVQSDKSGGRLVALGSLQFIMNQLLNIRDPDLAARGIPAARFPANGDLFCNSVFWLAHMEPLIAISPEAMEVSRIGDMSDGVLRAWRVGLLIVGLPGAVILCGMLVYFARRD
jgi:hypothetical protein